MEATALEDKIIIHKQQKEISNMDIQNYIAQHNEIIN